MGFVKIFAIGHAKRRDESATAVGIHFDLEEAAKRPGSILRNRNGLIISDNVERSLFGTCPAGMARLWRHRDRRKKSQKKGRRSVMSAAAVIPQGRICILRFVNQERQSIQITTFVFKNRFSNNKEAYTIEEFMLPEIKTRINVGKKVGLIGLTIALIVAFSLGFSIRSISLAQNETSLGVFLQALEIVKSVFVDKDISNTKLVYGAIKGMLESTEDPYTRFLEPKAFLDMTTRMEGQFFGVGIQIGMKKSRITVIAPIEGTPAARAKIKALDVIVSIDGFPTKGLSLEEAVSKIRGERGTKVLLEIEREGLDNNLKVSLVRDSIKIKSVTKVEMIDDTNKIGYIQLATFESRTSTEEISDAL
jgi:hypothetical protein